MSTLLQTLEADRDQMTEWFEHMHRNPELSMREESTARCIEDSVGQCGYDVETGIGKHGFVARCRTNADRELVRNKVRDLTRTQAETYGCTY